MPLTIQTRNTINFCSAYTLSAFGYEFILFIMTLYVYRITGEPFSVGIFTAVSLLPRLASPYYGSITDRHRRERVFGNAAGLTGLLLFAINVYHDVRWIYFIWFFISILAMLIMNVRTAIMTEVMPKDEYLKGNSTVLIALNLARILAPLIGGIIIGYYSERSLLLSISVFYFLVTVFSYMIHLPFNNRKNHRTAKTTYSHIKEGLQYIFNKADLRHLLFIIIVWRFFLGFQVSLFVVFVTSFLARADIEFGLFMALLGVGSILGSLCGPMISKRINSYKMIYWGLSIHFLLFSALGFINNYFLALVIVFVSYFIFYCTVVIIHSLRDKFTPVKLRGRVYGSIAAITTSFAVTSMLVGSYFAGLYGVEKVFIAGGLMATVGLFTNGILFSKIRLVKTLGSKSSR